MIASLVNHLWQSTIVALAVALAARLLENDAARIRYALWLAASLKFLVPFAALAALGAAFAPALERPILEITAGPIPLERLAAPIPAGGLPPAIANALVAVWLAGAALVLLQSVLRIRRLAALVDRATPAPQAPGAALPVRYSNARIEPALVGIRRPVLLLPTDVETRLSPAQLEAVIAHEVCHWRRRDNLTGALHMLIEALFWFCPLVWWIGARLVEERERACDEAVVAAGHDRRTYAEAILGVAELRAASPLKCAAGVGGIDLKGRVTAVMRSQAMKELAIHKKLLLSVGAFAAIALPVVGGWLGASSAALAEVDEYLPIFKAVPVYPPEAAAAGLEGYVIVEFTVNEEGLVEDLFIVESSSPLFEQAALDAARQFQYRPRVVNGVPVKVPGVRNRITFVVEHDDLA